MASIESQIDELTKLAKDLNLNVLEILNLKEHFGGYLL